MALVIGNGDYVHESRLNNPVNDARLIARTLRGLGFSVDERFNLRQRDMVLAINRFVRESAGADTALLYFAGHGMQPVEGGRNFLLPVDANIHHDDALDSDAVPLYRALMQALLPLAEGGGRIDATHLQALRQVLESPET